MALNPLGVDLPNDEDNICIICHNLLNTAPTYTLPECKHQYHTHCIITWFRHRKSCERSNPAGNYGYTIERDGRCPHCGDAGINNVTLQDGNFRSSDGFMTRREKELPEFVILVKDYKTYQRPPPFITKKQMTNYIKA